MVAVVADFKDQVMTCYWFLFQMGHLFIDQRCSLLSLLQISKAMAADGGGESFSAKMKRQMNERVEARKRRGDHQPPAPPPQPLPVGPPLPPPQPAVVPPPEKNMETSLVAEISRRVGWAQNQNYSELVKPSIFRGAIMKTRPLPALKKLSTLSGFERDFCKFLYKKVQEEADSGCRALSEPKPKDIKWEDLLNFEPEEYHQELGDTFPILMTCLTAVASKGCTWEQAIKVQKLWNK